MRSSIKLTLAFSALVAVGALFHASLDSPKAAAAVAAAQERSQERAEERRSLESFTTLHVPGSGKVIIRMGTESSVVVRTARNALDRVKTTVQGDRLSLTVSGNAPAVEYEITTPTLERIHISSSGDVSVRNEVVGERLAIDLTGSGSVDLALAVEELSVNLLGSGDVDVRGSTETLALRILGSGDLKAEGLNGKSASISVFGSGDTDLGEFEDLEVMIAGSGDLVYTGAPHISAKTPGSGKLRAR